MVVVAAPVALGGPEELALGQAGHEHVLVGTELWILGVGKGRDVGGSVGMREDVVRFCELAGVGSSKVVVFGLTSAVALDVYAMGSEIGAVGHCV